MEVDIDKLIQKSKGKEIQERTLVALDAENMARSRRSGFSRQRYLSANLAHPLLITENNIVLDGRHRLCKMFDQGIKKARVIVMSDKEIRQCEIKTKIV